VSLRAAVLCLLWTLCDVGECRVVIGRSSRGKGTDVKSGWLVVSVILVSVGGVESTGALLASNSGDGFLGITTVVLGITTWLIARKRGLVGVRSIRRNPDEVSGRCESTNSVPRSREARMSNLPNSGSSGIPRR
jgi:hypothetical protein